MHTIIALQYGIPMEIPCRQLFNRKEVHAIANYIIESYIAHVDYVNVYVIYIIYT